MKQRIIGNPQSSLASVVMVLGVVAVLYRYPQLVERPESLVALVGAVAPLFMRDPGATDGRS